MTITQVLDDTDVLLEHILSNSYQLILFNDDVNDLEWVVLSLMDVCQLTKDEAITHAIETHETGKSSIKQDTFEVLEPMAIALMDRKLNVVIEKI